MVGLAFEAARAAHDADAAELAAVEGGAGAGAGDVGAVEVDVAGDEEVELAVAVVVAPGGAGGPAADGDAGFFCDVGEGAVVVVAIEAIFAEVRDVDVWPAVVVEVADDGAEAPALVGDAGFFGDVGEGAVVIVVEEGGVRGGRFAVFGGEGGAADKVDVEPAVVVVVEEGDAGADGFEDDVFLGGAHFVLPGGEAGLVGDVHKDDGAGLDEAAGGDGAVLAIEDGGVGAAGVDAVFGDGLGALDGARGLLLEGVGLGGALGEGRRRRAGHRRRA